MKQEGNGSAKSAEAYGQKSRETLFKMMKYFHTKKTKMDRSKPSIHNKVVMLLGSPNGTILDMGSGNCVFADRLERIGWKVQKIDINPSYDDVKMIDLNYDNLPHFPKYNHIICLELLEHLENPFNALIQAYKTLKNGGTFILSTPYVNSLWQRLYFLFTGTFYRFDFVSHVSPMIEKKLLISLKRTGFIIEKIMFNRGTIPLLRLETKGCKFWGDNIIIVCKKTN